MNLKFLGNRRYATRSYWRHMNILYVVGGIISFVLLVYLIVAMLKPEIFS